MPEKTVKIPSVNCEHCIKTIEREISDLRGITSVRGNKDTKTVHIVWEEPSANWDSIKELLEEINFPPEE